MGSLHRQPQHGITRERRKVVADDRVGYDGNVVQNVLEPKRAMGGAPMLWLLREAEIPPAPARASSCAQIRR